MRRWRKKMVVDEVKQEWIWPPAQLWSCCLTSWAWSKRATWSTVARARVQSKWSGAPVALRSRSRAAISFRFQARTAPKDCIDDEVRRDGVHEKEKRRKGATEDDDDDDGSARCEQAQEAGRLKRGTSIAVNPSSKSPYLYQYLPVLGLGYPRVRISPYHLLRRQSR